MLSLYPETSSLKFLNTVGLIPLAKMNDANNNDLSTKFLPSTALSDVNVFAQKSRNLNQILSKSWMNLNSFFESRFAIRDARYW